MLRFAMVGIINTLIDFGVLNGLLWLDGYSIGWRILVYNSLAFAAANGNSYVMNKRWTFEDSRPASTAQVGLFLGLTLVGMVLNGLVVYLLTFSGWSPSGISFALWINLAKIIATIASMVWNFCSYRRWVFASPSAESLVNAFPVK